ncbi:MAG: hypothetical protein ACYTXC_03260, partial [Nostoc sp.]
FQCLNVHLIVTLTYNFLANHLDKCCLKWNETALLFKGGWGDQKAVGQLSKTCVYSAGLRKGETLP